MHRFLKLDLTIVFIWFQAYDSSYRDKPSEGIVVLAATDYAESLDRALVRSGRFEGHFVFPNEGIETSKEIVEAHHQQVLKVLYFDVRVSFLSCQSHYITPKGREYSPSYDRWHESQGTLRWHEPWGFYCTYCRCCVQKHRAMFDSTT